MSDAVKFWLDNKMYTGIKAAEAGGQMLVLYREKYYVVAGDAVQLKGGRPLQFSRSSMPTVWKKAMRGEVQMNDPFAASAEEAMPVATVTRRERAAINRMDASVPPVPDHVPARLPVQEQPAKEPKSHRETRKTVAKPSFQAMVAANCPYCHHRHEIPAERGKSGRPFFMPCSRCSNEFAVRFVQVTVYQAQVAGFR